jgi:preprotein translocase subunit SecG
MSQIPESQIHHLKESQKEGSFMKKIPWILLLVFLLLVIAGGLIYAYQYRDLPKCQDETVQILLNQNIRSNEVLIQNARTLAFEGIKEISHDNSQRFCRARLITNQGNYLVTYLVQNDLIERDWISKFLGMVEYSIKVEKIESTQ